MGKKIIHTFEIDHQKIQSNPALKRHDILDPDHLHTLEQVVSDIKSRLVDYWVRQSRVARLCYAGWIVSTDNTTIMPYLMGQSTQQTCLDRSLKYALTQSLAHTESLDSLFISFNVMIASGISNIDLPDALSQLTKKSISDSDAISLMLATTDHGVIERISTSGHDRTPPINTARPSQRIDPTVQSILGLI